ncbi:MAG: NAD(P)-dependent oxidoreductase, partial [Solirubrobacterales bacterium]
GIAVCNTPGVLDDTTADLAFLLILAAARLASEAERDLRADRWQGWRITQYLGEDVHGATLGLVGYGRIGRAVERRASGFGMQVLHHTRHDTGRRGFVADLDRLLGGSDIVSLHVPLTDETRHLIGARELALEEIEAVLSHPQASAQCARFIRERLPRAEVRAAASTADAVREVSARDEPWAALGAASAARIYDCVVLSEGVEDDPDNLTRFVWIARAGTPAGGEGPWRTTLCFSELGADHPGALVEALTEFSSRDVNLTRIESRPLRRGLGRYMFFVDLDGAGSDPAVGEAIDALRGKAENVRILGSYPIHGRGVPG